MMLATVPRAKSFLLCVICTSTNSPASAPGTNTTRPSARCPSASPPAAMRSTATRSRWLPVDIGPSLGTVARRRAHYPHPVPRIEIAPSVLPADFARLGEEVAALEAAGVDRIQWDVMDGQFVPNLTFGPDVIAAARRHTSLPFEAHLMVLTPDVMAAEYVKAGCSRLIVHVEACTHLHRTLANIASLGATASVALKIGRAHV